MVEHNSERQDNWHWVMNSDATESRLVVAVEVRGPDGEWIEKSHSIFGGAGEYEMNHD